jgi:hypothetical protein
VNYKNLDDPKGWPDKCPTCGDAIRWSLYGSRPGSEGSAYCASNISASRIDIKNLRGEIYCSWEGYTVRQRDGGVRFKSKDGSWVYNYGVPGQSTIIT